jgi:predicted branched-subunit amino acid permease
MAMYSAALVPHLGAAPLGARALAAYLMVDQSFAVAVRRYEDSPEMSVSEKTRYYFGCMAVVCPIWYGCTLAGALMGRAIPAELSLDFAVPVCFIALLAPLLRSLPHLFAALVSSVVTIALAGLPWNLGLPVAALAAMIAGAQAELVLRRRARKEGHA